MIPVVRFPFSRCHQPGGVCSFAVFGANPKHWQPLLSVTSNRNEASQTHSVHHATTFIDHRLRPIRQRFLFGLFAIPRPISNLTLTDLGDHCPGRVSTDTRPFLFPKQSRADWEQRRPGWMARRSVATRHQTGSIPVGVLQAMNGRASQLAMAFRWKRDEVKALAGSTPVPSG